jgi:hypothetical protein
MHCPQCGQQQISGEMRFCNSCGFPLEGVRELLASGGVSSTIERESDQSRQSPRRKGVRQGVVLLFITMVLVPLTMLFGRQANFLPPMLLMAGLMRILYAVIFEESAPRKKRRVNTLPDAAPSTIDRLETATRGTALPPAQSIPAASAFNARRGDTREMVNPPSVTEHTTKLLNESPDPK